MMMMMMKVGLPISLLSIWLSFGSADAMSLKETKICYILDAVLFIYGIVLTVLYCRMKMRSKQSESYSGHETFHTMYVLCLRKMPVKGFMRVSSLTIRTHMRPSK
uniref:High affinity immunoglobulin epsilon receptor subunit gamma-like n=1 Tax=Sinocyclocheilus rhinocerous TaxID=307959 RepID=A0A673HXA5_9TELE